MAAAEEWVAIESEGERMLVSDGVLGNATRSIGQSNTTGSRWDFPAPTWTTQTVAGDLVANVSIEAVGVVEVFMRLSAGGQTVALAPAKSIGPGDGGDVSWRIPVNGTWAPPLWWNITATGPYVSMNLHVDGATRLTIPVVAPTPMPVIRHLDVAGSALHIVADDLAADEIYYHWADAPSNVTARWTPDLVAGAADVQVIDAAGTVLLELSWPGDAGMQNLTGVAGDWTVHARHTAANGTYSLHLEPRTGPAAAPTARSTPMAWFLVPVALLAARRPRSG